MQNENTPDDGTNSVQTESESASYGAACSRLADYIESPPPYRKHVTKGRLWLVLDAHGDSILWSDQEIAVDAVVEALNHMAGIIADNAPEHATKPADSGPQSP